MKIAAGVAVAGCLLAGTLALAVAMPEDSLPEHVNRDAWISLGPDAGFVITGQKLHEALPGADTEISGYFAARHKGKWVRLNEEARFLPAH